MPQRRVNLTPRPQRRRKVPAYQVRRSSRIEAVAPESAPVDHASAAQAQIAQPERVDIRPEPAPDSIEPTEAFDPVTPDTREPDGLTPALVEDESSDAPPVPESLDAAVPAPESPDVDVDHVDEQLPEKPSTDTVQGESDDEQVIESDTSSDGEDSDDIEPDDGAEPDADESSEEETDYAAYLQSVEDAAARNLAMMRVQDAQGSTTATAVATAQPTATAGDATATAIYPVAQGAAEVVAPSKQRKRRAAEGGGNGQRPPGGRAVAGDSARQPDPRPRWRRPKTWVIAISSVLAIAVLAGLVYALYIVLEVNSAYNKAHVDPTPYTIWTINPEGTPVPVPTEERAQFIHNWDDNEPFNILLIGVDFRNGDTEPARSDTIIVVRVDPATKQVTMMSLPRDILVTIPGHGEDKINAAFALGENQQAGDGPALLSETISYNFNIPINYFVTIDFAGFRNVVDTIGGIVVDVPAPIKDDQYPTEDFGLTRAYFPAGLQEMDGETALSYARTRHADNDIARGERQQQVLLAIREQAVRLDLIRNADSLIRQFGDSVRTDLDFNQMLALANMGRGIDPQAITKVNLWELGVLNEHLSESEEDPYYMGFDPAMMRDLVAQYFPTKTPAAQTSTAVSGTAGTVEGSAPGNVDTPLIVQDNTSDNSGGPAATQLLTQAGFKAITQQMGTEISASTTIYDYINDPATANLVAQTLGLDPSAVVPGNGGTGILVVIGDDIASDE